ADACRWKHREPRAAISPACPGQADPDAPGRSQGRVGAGPTAGEGLPMADDYLDQMGPVDYLVVEFQESRLTGEGLPLLVNLVDRGIIRILDLVFLRKRMDGSVEAVGLSPVGHDRAPDPARFERASPRRGAG